MSHRPLVFVFGLSVADYLLWSWSSGGNHTVLALVSGLTLPPLAAACLWLVALTAGRLLAGAARRPTRRAQRRQVAQQREEAPTSGAPSETASRTLAA